MSFTVFGALGYIGANLVKGLRAQGHRVFTPDRSWHVDPAQQLGHVIYAIGVTGNFHTRPFDTVRAHVSRVAELLETAEFRSFTYLSSTRVYGTQRQTSEDAPLQVNPNDPSDLYNLSKLMGESICLHSGQRNVKIARLSNVVGRDVAGTKSFIGETCRQAISGCICLQSAPGSQKDCIWIDDVVMLLKAIAIDGQHRIYNVASGRNVSHDEWASALSAATGCRVEICKGALLTIRAQISVSRIAEEFGFNATQVLGKVPLIVAVPGNDTGDKE